VLDGQNLFFLCCQHVCSCSLVIPGKKHAGWGWVDEDGRLKREGGNELFTIRATPSSKEMQFSLWDGSKQLFFSLSLLFLNKLDINTTQKQILLCAIR